MSTTSPPSHPAGRGPDPIPSSPTSSPPTSSSPGLSTVRASNGERAEVVEALQHALGEGRLDLTETEERVASAYSAQYRSELLPLLADLPNSTVPSVLSARQTPSWAEIWRALVWRARLLALSDSASAAPTSRQCRTAAWITAVALAWFLLCALLGALAVGA